MTRSVQILAFDEMEVLDYAGPYEVFNVAGELGGGAFSVTSVGVTELPVGRGGFGVRPTYQLADAPRADIVVIPGGRGTRPLAADNDVLTWVRERAATAELVLTVCTGRSSRAQRVCLMVCLPPLITRPGLSWRR